MSLKAYKKSWQKAVSFGYLSLLQGITLIILQLRMFLRNTSLSDQMDSYIEQNGTLAASCEMGLAENRLTLMFAESFDNSSKHDSNICNTWTRYFKLPLWNCDLSFFITVYIYTYCVIFTYCVIITFFTLGIYKFSPNYELYEYPNIITSSVFALVNLILTVRLFLQFERKMYEKPVIELNKPALYRRMLIFVMMLKLDAFLVVINVSLTIAIIPFLGQQSIMFIIAYVIHASILLLSFLALILAYNSFIRQWKIGLYIFIVYWILFIADFTFLIKDGVSAASSGWYFWVSTSEP
ncbi:22872_t:CDS:2 [Gigaspora margarita]|uniref:22872_t:CDS:1 n=1 Tax=Gigaspora margarita TaxID=4874 RepID=A0ABN7UQ53_GIGMA|nr:22872_t:CDS:2 [Gigaspora margarita]